MALKPDRARDRLSARQPARLARDGRDYRRAPPGLPPSCWWLFLNDAYGVTEAVALRRQAEFNDERVTSLGRLVLETSQHASRLSRDFYLTPYGTDATRLAWA
jgi:hypothetical protein